MSALIVVLAIVVIVVIMFGGWLVDRANWVETLQAPPLTAPVWDGSERRVADVPYIGPERRRFVAADHARRKPAPDVYNRDFDAIEHGAKAARDVLVQGGYTETQP